MTDDRHHDDAADVERICQQGTRLLANLAAHHHTPARCEQLITDALRDDDGPHVLAVALFEMFASRITPDPTRRGTFRA